MPPRSTPELICFSHLRWSFVFQRPQHLMTRLAGRRRVFFVEEPVLDDGPDRMVVERCDGVHVAVPHLARASSSEPQRDVLRLRRLVDEMIGAEQLHDFIAWYYTPMALAFTGHLRARMVVYDCMDELANFAGAPTVLRAFESQLLRRADLVTTGGRSLYEAKRDLHPDVHLFPSSVDAAHFRRARDTDTDPADQAFVPRPRIGYAGVIDERMDLDLLRGVAAARPEWQLVMLGPVVKIDPATLPVGPNLHYLGMKPYAELPLYMAGWDVAMLPFARNDATRYISPTKTPEYLAAGRPVVSTSVRDVVRPYGVRGLAHIGDTVHEFIVAIERALATDLASHRASADAFLARMSWDDTAMRIDALLDAGCSASVARTMGAP